MSIEYGSPEWYEERIMRMKVLAGDGEAHIPTTVQCRDCVGQEAVCHLCGLEQDIWIARLATIRGETLDGACIAQEDLITLQRRATL